MVIWFQKKNAAGLSPQTRIVHKGLVSQGEEWMKKTRSELMVVAALIVTITFAGAITFEGGHNQDTGTPVLMKKKGYLNIYVHAFEWRIFSIRLNFNQYRLIYN